MACCALTSRNTTLPSIESLYFVQTSLTSSFPFLWDELYLLGCHPQNIGIALSLRCCHHMAYIDHFQPRQYILGLHLRQRVSYVLVCTLILRSVLFNFKILWYSARYGSSKVFWTWITLQNSFQHWIECCMEYTDTI